MLLNKLKVILCVTLALFLLKEPSLLAKTTSKNCSPNIDRTGGNVIVKCGPADVDVNFLLEYTRVECNEHRNALSKWFANGVRQGNYYFPYFPQFSPELVAELVSGKTAIAAYDTVNFIKLYSKVVKLPRLYGPATDVYGDLNNRLGREAITYLETVNELCLWVGFSIDIEEHRPFFDIRHIEPKDWQSIHNNELLEMRKKIYGQ